MGPKPQKDPLMVEGLDINAVQLPTLLRHVSKMLEDLMLERGERTRAQMECDLVRTAWQNTEKELQEAKVKRMKLHMEGESLGELNVDAFKKADEELQFVKYQVTMSVLEKERNTNAQAQKFEQKVLEQDVPSMLDKKRKIQQDLYEKKNKLMEEVEIAGKEVVEVIDRQFAFSEGVLLKRICSMLKNVSIRSKYLSVFYKVQMMKLQEEKNKLISELEQNNEFNFLRIQDFFKQIVKNDIVLIFSLQEKLRGMEDLKMKRLQFIQEVAERLDPLKELMLSSYNELKIGYRMARMYEQNYKQYNDYVRLAKERDNQINYLQKKKKDLLEEIKRSNSESESFAEATKMKKEQSRNLLETVSTDASLFECYGEYFRQLAEYVDEEENLEKLRPGVLQELRERLANEHEMVKQIHMAITKEMKFTNDLVDAANRKFAQLGYKDQPQFVKVAHKKFPYQEGPSGIINT